MSDPNLSALQGNQSVITIDPAAQFAGELEQLRNQFNGELLTPGSPGYDDARRVHNGLADKHPAVIARCRGAADVVDALGFARAHRLEIAIRGGGHNVSGRATVDDGMMLDLSLMKGIHVDPERRIARVQPGVTWGELNRETQLHKLATTGGVISSTGVAGLTLGGGLGWLMGKYGLTVDNLLSVELVTAEGDFIRASETENEDLFWAVRGGGGNFGVVVSFEFRLHPVGPLVTAGITAHPYERAADVLRFFRDFTREIPDELTLAAGLIHAPDGSGTKLAGIIGCHCGSLEDGEIATAPIKTFGPPIMDALGPMPYRQTNAMLDLGYPRGALNYWKSAFLSDMSDAAIQTMVECFAHCPSPMSTLLIEHIHGAATRVPAADTAFPHRLEGYNLLILAQWMNPMDTKRCIDWARETYGRVRPFMGNQRYSNYLDRDDADAAAAAYGENYPRLQAVKARYDAGNIFHLNQNIRPA